MCLMLLFSAKMITLAIFFVAMPLCVTFIGSVVTIKFAILTSMFICVMDALHLCNCAVLFLPVLVLLLIVPVNVIPTFAMSLYSFFLGLSGLLTAFLEPYAITSLSMLYSQKLVDESLQWPTFNKGIILAITVTCYTASVKLGFLLLFQGEAMLYWPILCIVVLAILIGTASIIKDEGIISDAAVITVGMFWFISTLSTENSIKTQFQITDQRHLISIDDAGTSILAYFWIFTNSVISFADFGKLLLGYYLSGMFLLQVFIRISSFLYMLSIIMQYVQESPMVTVDKKLSSFPNILQILITIFAYTELLLTVAVNIRSDINIPAWQLRFFISNRSIKVTQALSLAIIYLWRMANVD
ncbi:hypothetical protein TrispH2_011381 [Trichoplax sp. H2]|nr:hypothetical protein TrispH2_011381 [Trichoplax sp. H2]|eukprot:RDD36467.1 hypothetical protein TrispH2_011381 [Trichoplax sp. H2]